MKKNYLALGCLILVISSVMFAQPADTHAFLEKIDSMVSFRGTDLSAEYTVITKEPGGGTSKTVTAIFRRDSKEQFVVLILEPANDKGKGYFKDQEILWLYDPEDNSFTSTSIKNKFQSSSIRVSDFNPSAYAENYRVVGESTQKLGKFDCVVLDLEAKNNSVTYDKSKIWVSEDNLVRKVEDYSLSGQLMRTTAIPTYQKIADKWIPQTIVIQDHMLYKEINNKIEYERTTITIKNPSLTSLPDMVYTKEYLQRAR